MQDQNHGVLSHSLAGKLPVGLLQGVQGSFLAVTQAIKAAEFIPVEDLGKGLLGMAGDGSSGVHQASRTSFIAQGNRSKLLLGPGARVGKTVHEKTIPL
jgi:hypothetical protein